MATATIDGREFDLSKLSDVARAQAANIQFVDSEIARLHTQILVYQAARETFALKLQQALPKE